MRQKSGPEKQPAEEAIKDIRCAMRHFSAEEKICSVLEGLRGEESIAELCRCEGIASSMYYGGSKEFLEASVKSGLPGPVRENIVEEEAQLANGADSMVASTVDRDDPSRAICQVSARKMTAGWIPVVAQVPGVALAIGVEKTASVIGMRRLTKSG